MDLKRNKSTADINQYIKKKYYYIKMKNGFGIIPDSFSTFLI